MLEGLKEIAAFLSEQWRTDVSQWEVWRAIKRRTRDPLPAYKPLGRWQADPVELRSWAHRARAPVPVAPQLPRV